MRMFIGSIKMEEREENDRETSIVSYLFSYEEEEMLETEDDSKERRKSNRKRREGKLY